MPEKAVYHEHQRILQDRFDGRRLADALAQNRRRTEFTNDDRHFIETSEFFFLATAHEDSVDCSFKGGHLGFVRITGPASLEWPEYDGNSMYRSLGNILGTPRVGLLFMRFGDAPQRLRVNGSCSLLDAPSDSPFKLTIQMQVESIFSNCPRYIPDLESGMPSPHLPGKNGVGAKPDWKNKPALAPHLPAKDPHRDS